MLQLDVRPSAAEQVKLLIRGQKPDVAVRVYAQPGGGGCCGGGSDAIQFGMAFAKARPDDEVLPQDGFTLIVDPMSRKFVDGAVIDYVEDLDQSGFKVTNPTLPVPDAAGQAGGCSACGSNAANGGGCGCGSH
jgi:iron-sulfur cluster assembly protein